MVNQGYNLELCSNTLSSYYQLTNNTTQTTRDRDSYTIHLSCELMQHEHLPHKCQPQGCGSQVLVCSNCNFYLLCPKVHLTSLFLLSTVEAVLAELQQADLISSEECEGLHHISGVVDVQKGKSPEVMSKTADVLRRHGFEKESTLLAGRQSRPSSICLCYVVQWSLLMTATL